MKLCTIRLSFFLALAAFGTALGQDITPPPSGTPALPPLERLANDAQQALFNAADRAAGPKTSVAPNGGQVTTTGRKATFSAPKLEDPSTWKKDSRHKLAIMTVSFGGNVEEVMFELYPQDAPMTVSNFLDNVETGAYNGLAFHRAIQGFIVQTGDPLTSDEAARERWGTGGEGKSVLAEIKRTHRKGAVAMGRKSDKTNPGKKSNGYQFYFALGNYASLDNNYTVFGQVVSGIDVLERISKMPVDSNDCPIARIEVKSIKINDHKGPLYVSTQSDGDTPKYSKPSSARGPFGRFLNSVW